MSEDQTNGIAEIETCDVERVIARAKELHSSRFPEAGPPPDGFPANSGSLKDFMVLITKNVTDDMFDKYFLPIYARYNLRNGDLYVRKVAGECHSCMHAVVTTAFGIFGQAADGQNANLPIEVYSALNSDFDDGKKLELDVSVKAKSENGQKLLKCVIEVEVAHRSSNTARKLAAHYMTDENLNTLVLIKVWPRRQAGTFAAACIVWEREGDGTFGCTEAYDFGTGAITDQVRNSLSAAIEADEDITEDMFVPCVPRTKVFATPQPGPGRTLEGRDPQILEISPNSIVANVPTGGVPLINMVQPTEGPRINLTYVAKKIESNLPANGGGDTEET